MMFEWFRNKAKEMPWPVYTQSADLCTKPCAFTGYFKKVGIVETSYSPELARGPIAAITINGITRTTPFLHYHLKSGMEIDTGFGKFIIKNATDYKEVYP